MPYEGAGEQLVAVLKNILIITVMSCRSIRFWPHLTEARVASTRIRCLQMIEALKRLDIDVDLYRVGCDIPSVLVMFKRYDSESLRHAVDLREKFGTKLVIDICDNHFYFEGNDHKAIRRREQLRNASSAVDLIVTSSDALAQVVFNEIKNARVCVIPDSLDMGISTPLPRKSVSDVFNAQRWSLFRRRNPVAFGRRLLWFGSHGSPYVSGGMEDLESISTALSCHHAIEPLTLCIVSNNWRKYRDISKNWSWPTFYFPWSECNFRLAAMDNQIAVIPIRPNPFTLCKSNNRVATSFNLGLAVAADAIPSYEEFRESALLDDWDFGLGTLMRDNAERMRRTTAARQVLMSRYRPEIVASHWVESIIRAGL